MPLIGSLFSHKDGRKQVGWVFLALILSCLLLALKIAGSLIPALIISGSGDQLALAKPGICGFNTLRLNHDDLVLAGAGAANELLETVDSRRYASERYAYSPAAFTTEPVFPIDSLPFEVIRNVPCPFDPEMCLLGPNTAVSFDF